MALRTKVPCICNEDYYLEWHPNFKRFPSLCPWCHGTKEAEWDVTFDYEKYKGRFKTAKGVKDYDEDTHLQFKCQCGDEISTIGGDLIACQCGRVYYFDSFLKVNEDHLGDAEYLINKYKEERK